MIYGNQERMSEIKAEGKRIARRQGSIAIAYILIGFLCYGWCVNHPNPQQAVCDGEGRAGYKDWCYEFGDSNSAPRQAGSIVAGALWPVWLTATVAIHITKWP